MDGLGQGSMDMMDPENIAALTASPYPEPGPASMPPQEDVDEFLRKKRKARDHKACYPCRSRKVKYVHLRAPFASAGERAKPAAIMQSSTSDTPQMRSHTPLQDVPGARAPRIVFLQPAISQASEHRPEHR